MQYHDRIRFGLIRIPVMAALLSFTSRSARAEPSPGDSSQAQNQPALTEVVVTARRREESAQTVPVTVTALSSEQLEERHIQTGQDLQGQVPSLSVSPYGQGRDTEMFVIRGQSTQYGAPAAVQQYMAEVPLVPGTITSVQGSPGQFLDLANVQVLNGPQGTLFGRNTTGGAILLEPARPTKDFSGSIQLQAGNYEDKEVQAVVNVPLTDSLQARFAGEFVDRGGFTRDAVTGMDYDNHHYWSGRLGVAWKPGDAIDNYLMLTGSKSETNGNGWVLDRWNVPYIEGVFAGFGGCEGVGLGAGCSVLTQLQAAQEARGPREISLGPFTPPLDTQVESWTAADQLKFVVSDNLIVRNIISYSSLNALAPFDGDGSPLPWYNANMSLHGYTDAVRQFTEELQVQGNAVQQALQYTAGLYYEELKTPARVDLANNILFSYGGSSYSYTNNARAVYAQFTYDLRTLSQALAGLRLTAGGRYTWDNVHAVGGSFALAPDNTPLACTNGVLTIPTTYADCDQQGSVSSSAPNWNFGLDYLIREHVFVYAKATHGYKRGGFNFYAVNPSHLTFAPEYVTTYETGFKSNFHLAEIPVRFNADIFYTDYTDVQIAAGDYNLTTFASGAAVYNAAAAHIRGIEVEAAISPLRGLEISGNYSHLNGKFTQFAIQNPFGQFDCSGGFVVGSVNLSCMPFSYLPEDQFSVSAAYTLPLPPSVGSITAVANYAYTGAQYETTTQLPAYEPGSYFPSFGILNLTLNWNNLLKSQFDIGFYMTNATDKTYRISNTGVFNSIGVASNLYGEPRMYGLQLRYHW
jgi:iron complex outermembrane receptor protein